MGFLRWMLYGVATVFGWMPNASSFQSCEPMVERRTRFLCLRRLVIRICLFQLRMRLRRLWWIVP